MAGSVAGGVCEIHSKISIYCGDASLKIVIAVIVWLILTFFYLVFFYGVGENTVPPPVRR